MRTLRVTADDFGLCHEVNAAVCRLHDEGILGHTSLIANGEDFDRSAEELRRRPELEVGIHLNLTDGRPILPAEEVSTLVGGDGAFLGGRHFAVLAGILGGRFSAEEIFREWRAQIVRAREAGIEIAHLNAHGHLHLVPRLHGIVLRLVSDFRIRFLRLVLSADSARGLVLRRWSLEMIRRMQSAGTHAAYPDRVLGLGRPGSLDRWRILRELEKGAEGVTELIVHPATAANLHHRRWRYSGESELRALLDPEVAGLIRGWSATHAA